MEQQLTGVHQIQATGSTFAAILTDGSVVAWGVDGSGGDASIVPEGLQNVQQIQASMQAFAAILSTGSVVTWGSALHGGDSSAVQAQLRDVLEAIAVP